MNDDPTLDFIGLAKAAFDTFEAERVKVQPEGLEIIAWSDLPIWERDVWIAVVKKILVYGSDG